MNAESSSPSAAAKSRSAVDRKSNAGTTPDPWDMCALLEYGGDRTYAWNVRQEIILTPPEGRAGAEGRLLKALGQAGCTEAGRQFICQMLVLVGSAKCVPALVPLLRDPSSAESARYALDAIPGAEATAALRDALASTTGRTKAGVIGSLAMRRDAGAKSALATLKDNSSEPAIVREAAARALEHLANAQA